MSFFATLYASIEKGSPDMAKKTTIAYENSGKRIRRPRPAPSWTGIPQSPLTCRSIATSTRAT
jgi:hypothetical protein